MTRSHLSRVPSAGLLLALLSSLVACGAEARKMPPLRVSKWISKAKTTAKELKGRPHVIEFWATWCGPCRATIPHLARLAAVYEPMGMPIIGLTSEPAEQMDEIKSFAKELKMNYHVGLDDGMGQELKVQGIPQAFVVTQDGAIAWQGHPMDPEFEQALRKAFDAWQLPADRFPKTAKAAAAILHGESKEGIAPLKATAKDKATKDEAAKAIEIVENMAKARITALGATKDSSPVEYVIAAESLARQFAGLEAADKLAAEAAKMAKKPELADEVAVLRTHRKLAEDIRKGVSDAQKKGKNRTETYRLILGLLEESLVRFDELIGRYPDASKTEEARKERAQIKESIKSLAAQL